MAKKEKSFYQRLTRLFRSGPAVRRKIKGQDYKNFYDSQVVQNNLGYYGAAGFKREASPFSVMGAYGILDRMSRYAEFAEMENCLHGDTKIAVPGGYKTLKELTEEYGREKEFVVYSYSQEKKAIVPAKARAARLTTTDHAYKVKFDNGKEIIGTKDHQLMKRDGTYCEIGNLKPNDAMMPFYRRSLIGKKTGPELQENCYQLIYTMNKEDSPSRWISEHRLLGKFIVQRHLKEFEVVHHKNFKAHDNCLENLELMAEEDHQKLHSKILNGKKWDTKNNAKWIKKFKEQHSEWMKENNPAERKDITFDNILEWCRKNTYNLKQCSLAFNTDVLTIKRKISKKGYKNFVDFAKANLPTWEPYNGNPQGENNGRFLHSVSFDSICSVYQKGMKKKDIAKIFNCSVVPIEKRLKESGFLSWKDFTKTYENCKVQSVEYFGIVDLYDLTVDGYQNFATDSVIAHNCAEIASALNVYADESCAQDETGQNFHIYSDNEQIQKALEELFYDVMNIEFNARRMVRNLVKNGDYFMYVEVVPDYGVINVEPLPVNEVEREEGFDKHDPYAVRFRLITRGGKYLENWQMLHFRILGNDLFIPYGTSFLESARRPWRQLCHLSGTRVLTSTGYKNIEDIVAGETVYTHIPESKQTVKAKVKHVLDMGKQPIVSVETLHRTIKVTPNHGLLTLDKNGTFLYKKASDLVQSHGQGGNSSKNADKLVLPAVMSGNPSLQINFQDLANNYSVKLAKKAPEIERKGIIQRLKKLGTATGHKNVHLFLNGSKKLSWSDYQLVQQEFGLTAPVEYYYRHSKKKSVFFNSNNHSYEFDKDFMKFFGFMLGDGWVKSNGFGFALGVHEQQNEEYIGYASKLFGNDYSLSVKEGTQSAQVNWSNTEVADVFRHIGFKTEFANKYIPNWIYDLDLSARRALVQGMFDADGCDNTKTIYFANKKLMEQTQELCWTIGIPTGKTISVRPEREGHKESYKLWLDLTKPTEEVFYENVLRVVQEEQGQTWDLEVDHEEHNFLANGIVTHNTMMEDSMLVYRLVRSPERRIFYVDVSAIHPNDVPSYMEAVKESMRGASVIEQQQGRQDFRYNPLPVHKDTMIPLLDGRTITIENLAAEFNTGKTNWVYSVQDKTNKIVAGKVVWCGKNYTAEKLIKVTLDDGTWIKTAPEHPFVLRDGTSCRADELKPEMSLMPLYRRVSTTENGTHSLQGYEMVQSPDTGKWEYTHRLVGRTVLKENLASVMTTAKSAVVHHVDFNKLNNSPSNLKWMSRAEHSAYHGSLGNNSITKYNKSEAKRQRTSHLNRVNLRAQHMGSVYNGTPLHSEHNVIRRAAQLESWKTNKQARSAAMRFSIPNKCVALALEVLSKDKTITRDKLYSTLLLNSQFKLDLLAANSSSNRNIININPRVFVERLAEAAGVCGFRGLRAYQNHKVASIETIIESSDVYCMTVVGPNGEEDRHNFAAATTDTNGTTAKSAILLKNSVDEDYFLPTRPNSQTKIENIAGGQNTTAVEDVEYILKKLIAALMVPKAYLTYDEAISCFVPETKVSLLDGRELTFPEIREELLAGKELWTYSIDQRTNTVVPGKITDSWEAKTTDDLVRVTLDNNESFVCTSDHKWMDRTGSYIQAKDLVPGTSLMPLYRRVTGETTGKRNLVGYEQVFNPGTNKWEYTHLVVDREKCSQHQVKTRRVIHHVDFNKRNNAPPNLTEMNFSDHRLLHQNALAETNCRNLCRWNKKSTTTESNEKLLNHSVLSVEKINETKAVWDITVDKWHNFALSNGTFVKNSKATLAQEDIRFSRTVANLQKIILAELNKLAIIHLYSLGFAGDDLTNYELKFSNPSTVAVQQKLALVSSRIEIAAKAWELSKETGIFSKPYIQREILGLRPEEINIIKQEAKQDQVDMAELKKLAENPPFDNSIESSIDIFDKANYDVPSSPFAPDKKEITKVERQNQEDEREYQAKRAKEREEKGYTSGNGAPIRFNSTPNLDKSFRRSSRKKNLTGDRALSLPNFGKMLDVNNRYAKDPYDMKGMKKFVLETDDKMQRELLGENYTGIPFYGLNKEIQHALRKMHESLMRKTVDIKGIEIITENNTDDSTDELFMIENELKTKE